jgi:hypothetical protein
MGNLGRFFHMIFVERVIAGYSLDYAGIFSLQTPEDFSSLGEFKKPVWEAYKMFR